MKIKSLKFISFVSTTFLIGSQLTSCSLSSNNAQNLFNSKSSFSVPTPFKVTYSEDCVNVDLSKDVIQTSNGTLESNAQEFKISGAQFIGGDQNLASCIDLNSIYLPNSVAGHITFNLNIDKVSSLGIKPGQFAQIKLDFLSVVGPNLYTNTTSLTLTFKSIGVAPQPDPQPEPSAGFTPAAYFVNPIFPLVDESKAFNLPFNSQSTSKESNNMQRTSLGGGGGTVYSITGGSFDTASFNEDVFPVITFENNGIDNFNKYFKLAKGKQLSLESLIKKGAFSKKPTLTFLTSKNHQIANLKSKITVNLHGHNGTFTDEDFDISRSYDLSLDFKNVAIPKKGERVEICSEDQKIGDFSFKTAVSLDFENDLFNTSDLYVKYFPVPKDSGDTVPGHYEIVTATGEPLTLVGMTNSINGTPYSKKFINNQKIVMDNQITDFSFANVSYVTIDNSRNKTWKKYQFDKDGNTLVNKSYCSYFTKNSSDDNQDFEISMNDIHMYSFTGEELSDADKSQWLNLSESANPNGCIKLTTTSTPYNLSWENPTALDKDFWEKNFSGKHKEPQFDFTFNRTKGQNESTIDSIGISSSTKWDLSESDICSSIDSIPSIYGDLVNISFEFVGPNGYSSSIIPTTLTDSPISNDFSVFYAGINYPEKFYSQLDYKNVPTEDQYVDYSMSVLPSRHQSDSQGWPDGEWKGGGSAFINGWAVSAEWDIKKLFINFNYTTEKLKWWIEQKDHPDALKSQPLSYWLSNDLVRDVTGWLEGSYEASVSLFGSQSIPLSAANTTLKVTNASQLIIPGSAPHYDIKCSQWKTNMNALSGDNRNNNNDSFFNAFSFYAQKNSDGAYQLHYGWMDENGNFIDCPNPITMGFRYMDFMYKSKVHRSSFHPLSEANTEKWKVRYNV